MTIRVAINHQTTYHYDHPVQLGPHVLRLRPAPHSRTPIHAYSLKLTPENHFLNWQQDPFGNYQARVVFPEKTRELTINVEVIAELTVINPFDFFVEEYAEKYPFEYDEQLQRELTPYFELRESGPLLKRWLAAVDREPKSIVDFLVQVNQRLSQDIAYNVRMEPGVQTCEQTLDRARGSCRDSGWLLVQILRHLGLAARFVSGYLVQLTADVKSLDGPSGPAQDFTDLHAWAEVYVPGAGWLGLDPTSGLFAGEGHIPLACTPDPVSAAPVTGGFSGEAKVTFDFANTVTRIHEDPRVTKPYSDEQWQAIDQLGEAVDARYARHDVRLTMGGEPTFVSIDDMESAQWNTDADGPHKRDRAAELLRRLHSSFAPGGVLHFAQGKWYPGEPLPRWAWSCFWRADGTSVWQRPELIADMHRDYGFGLEQAQRFLHALTEHLSVPSEHIVAGYEDALYYLWKEGNLPDNVDPMDANLDDPLERRTLTAVLNRGLGKPVGFALPLRRDPERGRWRTCAWQFRRGHMFLLPGDSPMGLRLPLDALPWVDPKQREPHIERSLFEPMPALGDFAGEVARRYSRYRDLGNPHPELAAQPSPSDDAADRVFHTALCVEAREGRLYAFLPPLTHLEHYLDLVASIEATAAALDMPVVMEGYEPPRDPRLKRLSVTPDPGVIEVNIHPAASWRELVDNTATLYEQAHQSRLSTEKFMIDGRHTGTGGGNHVTIGGATPSDSPLLRRPDVLRSLITYWQHHPGLSYLFSGMFIGPTSQAPRVDEGRDEALYELELAFQQMPDGEVAAPWLVDRLLRHLLVDVTGNTHRAEFCIDKLYSPDAAQGRLGLLELRAFEMPPHARMSAVQTLLLRSLIAWFWEQPYRQPLVRWGTELHDRFMLPHYVDTDVRDVVTDLRQAGYEFEHAWLAPFMEFRFPHYGSVQYHDIELDLRFAIEPWHVLGEEVTSTGTARFVDSSVERLQIKATGLVDGRHTILCNGRRVPLRCTGTKGEYAAGVRYRAWHPPSALHPSIGVHAPLVFDVFDTWNGRAIGGCTYHVGHPGGRNYDTFPVNAYEAESRRVSRFWSHGHTPGSVRFDAANLRYDCDPELPYTLDLRRQPPR